MTNEAVIQLDQQFFINRVKLLFDQYFVGYLNTIAVALVTIIVLWGKYDDSTLLNWFGLVLTVVSIRLYIVYGGKKQLVKNYLYWQRRYYAFLLTAFLLGIVWGLLGTYFFAKANDAHQAFIIVILVGMCSGALPLMYQIKNVFIAFVSPILFPFAISLAASDEITYQGISIISLFYFSAMYLVAKRGERSVIESIKLRFENYELIEELEQAKSSLITAKSNLERRVKERTTELERVNEGFFQQKELAETTLKSIADGIITTDEFGLLQNMNASAENLTGFQEPEVAGLMFSECIQIVDEKGNEIIEEKIQESLKNLCTIHVTSQSLLMYKDHSSVAVKVSIAPIFNSNRNILGVVIVLHNINKERLYQLQLTHQANHDALTGLHNRFAFEEYLKQLLNEDESKDVQHAIIYIDLDNFKIVNDSCGHAAGDELLKQLSIIMPENIPSNDMFARLGGDEFGIIIKNMSSEESKKICEQILNQLRDFRFSWQGNTFSIGASIGLFVFTTEYQTIENIMSAADIACFTAKERGRNRLHTYSREDQELIYRKNELNWVSKINEAIENEKLILYSQPIIDSHAIDEPVRHIEILIRMLDDDNEILLPGQFITAAERYNMMPQVDRWVINKVFDHFNHNALNMMTDDSIIAINLSGNSLADKDLLTYIEEKLKSSQLLARHLCIEITETAVISNMSQAIQFINKMRNLGCKFAIDDFGSGLSSLGYLKNLPVDYVKIDGCFVRDMANDPVNYAMVESIHKLVSLNGKITIAEYVESEEIFSLLNDIGIKHMQGYALGKPARFVM